MSRREGDSTKWMLDSVEIDRIADVAVNDNHDHRSPKGGGAIFGRSGSKASKRQGNVPQPKMGRMQSSAARGLKSLRFLDGAGKDGDSWKPIEKRFNHNSVQGRLPREKFGAVIGMGDSKEFATELYETLARRRNVDASNGITIDEMRMFWEDMTSQDIDARLQIFFDM